MFIIAVLGWAVICVTVLAALFVTWALLIPSRGQPARKVSRFEWETPKHEFLPIP